MSSLKNALVLLFLVIDFIPRKQYSNGIYTDTQCGHVFNVSSDEKYLISFKDAAVSNNIYKNNGVTKLRISTNSLKCQIVLTASPSHRLRLAVTYTPKTHSCSHGYIHIGNDKYRPDVESMTSYKFCDHVSELEIVSRNNYLWIVYDNKFGSDDIVSVQIQAQLPVTCDTTMFECSPLQCIPANRVCDGIQDCQNSRDEYCDDKSIEPCFMCEDKTCIRPELPVYHVDRGKPMWYICDGVYHCKDGTDERKDMCFRSKSVSSNLLQCNPMLYASLRRSKYSSVLMWNHRKCDGVQDCLHGEDELCQRDKVKGEKEIEPVAFSITGIAVIFVFIGSSIFIYSLGRKQRLRRQTEACLSPQIDPMETCRLQGLDTVTEEPENLAHCDS